MKPHRVVIAVFPPVQLLDVGRPLNVFSFANELSVAQGRALPTSAR